MDEEANYIFMPFREIEMITFLAVFCSYWEKYTENWWLKNQQGLAKYLGCVPG